MERIKTLAVLAVAVLIACISVCACVDGDNTQPDVCGPFPSRGNYSYILEQRSGASVAVVPLDEFKALEAERHAMKQWYLCTTGQ